MPLGLSLCMSLRVRLRERTLGMRFPRVRTARAADPLKWIDDFFREAGSHIFAREEDGVVILPPNQVYKANATGIAIVRHMLNGSRASRIPGIRRDDRMQQVAAFVSDVRALYLGEAAADGRAPYETVPYTFQYTTLPILGEIAVTYRCNNACVFCYAGCGAVGCTGAPRSVTGDTEMSLAEAKEVIDNWREHLRDQWDWTDTTFSSDGQPSCNSHYARQLIFWSIPLALSGQQYSAPEKKLSFNPRPDAPRCLPWLIPAANGLLERLADGKYRMTVLSGNVALDELRVGDAVPVGNLVLQAGQSVDLQPGK